MNCNFAVQTLGSRPAKADRSRIGIFYTITRDLPLFLHSVRGKEIAMKTPSPSQVVVFEYVGVSRGRYHCKTVAKLHQ